MVSCFPWKYQSWNFVLVALTAVVGPLMASAGKESKWLSLDRQG